ncbi:hypothetical protein FOI42_RS03115 [Escherichia coli]|nr:hypothetical protein [Escherichia coli]EFL4883385.1 hypothetical protein [Escherichia coli]MED6699300.1 hypothetical protein [Escherichia coli O157]USL83379.1 hypothetical protein A4_303 [Escherichia phage A4]HCQ0858687.1 hypothetical protein [Escherichia coli]
MINILERIKETTTLVDLLNVLTFKVTRFSTPEFINLIDSKGEYRITIENGRANVFSTKSGKTAIHSVIANKTVAI